MRRSVRLAAVVAVSLYALLSASAAHSQGLVQWLFGPSRPAVAKPVPTTALAVPGHGVVLRAPGGGQLRDAAGLTQRRASEPRLGPADHGAAAAGRSTERGEGLGSFTTVCVRLCDGYYWPQRHGARRRDFQSESRQCESSCGEEARLYVMPDRGAGGIETAVDLNGVPYSRLSSAFLYRKSLMNGCACRPSPWSVAELARHRDYALAEDAARRQADEQLASSTPASWGSYRSAQEAGLTSGLAAVAAVDRVEPARQVSAARAERRTVAAVDRAERHGQSRGTKRSAGVAAPRTPGAAVPVTASKSAFNPLAGLATTAYTWPGDPVRR